tara:strand:+ start:6019 stop:6903 length:885 start_codon:yes stop_codon:yes gene_type:complete
MLGLHSSNIPELKLLARGKVRDIYEVDADHLLIIASDRISAFDVILDDPIPGKGQVLTRVSNFWFDRVAKDIPNHLTGIRAEAVVKDITVHPQLVDRATVVKRCKPLAVEAIVRGYIIGSGWKDYEATGAISGIELPPGLSLAERLPEPIFTPSTKAAMGAHDENIDFAAMENQIGVERAAAVRSLSLRLYQAAAEHALARGIIIADTKFEFGEGDNGELVLIDEILTPDSSRFWPADAHRHGTNPASFDKQYVRDYLETLDWNKTAPAPRLPAEVLAGTAERYAEAEQRLIAA